MKIIENPKVSSMKTTESRLVAKELTAVKEVEF